MKLILVLYLFSHAVAASQQPNSQDVQILRYETDNKGLGSYRYVFELSDGTEREEDGEVINAGTENESIIVRGSYSWIGPDGVTYGASYIADANGFQPQQEQDVSNLNFPRILPSAVIALLGNK